MIKKSYRSKSVISPTATSFIPKKRLGQNFLVDPNIREKIISHCALQSEDTVLEIGPGLGFLTQRIAENARKVFAIETDAKLCVDLKKQFSDDKVAIIHADFLSYAVEKLPMNLKVIGNLPYNISSPIIDKVLSHPRHFESFYTTVQYELGQRMTAKPNTKSYGAFSCFVQYFADVKLLFKIKNTAFRPVPKVQSCFLRFQRKEKNQLSAKDEKLLFKIIRGAFQQRRKMIGNSLSALLGREKVGEAFEKLGLDSKIRAENLSLQDYINLSNLISCSS